MKKVNKFAYFMLLITLVLCASIFGHLPSYAATADSLIGTWERFGDTAEGTQVIVTKVDGYYQSKLLIVKGTLIDLGFAKDDLKWKELTFNNDGTYTGFDLFRYEYGGYEYRNCSMFIDSDGILKVSVANSGETEVIIGTYQTWRKISTGEQPSSWAIPEITLATQYGLTTDKVLRNYTGNITREEFCEIVIKLYEKLSNQVAMPVSPNPFSDTVNVEVLKAYNLGIINGTSATTFAPNSSATREQIAIMLLKALTKAKPSVVIDTTNVSPFSDQNQMASWAIEPIQFFNKNGIINGFGGGIIKPKGYTTREQAIAMIKNVYVKFLNQ